MQVGTKLWGIIGGDTTLIEYDIESNVFGGPKQNNPNMFCMNENNRNERKREYQRKNRVKKRHSKSETG